MTATTQIMTEADTCRALVTPKLIEAGWSNAPHVIGEQRTFTNGRIIVTGGRVRRGKQKRADYLLYYRRDYPLAVVEAKKLGLSAETGVQQAKEYAEILGLKFAYATNGHRIIEIDYTWIRAHNEQATVKVFGQDYNPPFGVDWKAEKKTIDRWPNFRGYNGKLPRINDGALLFLLYMMSKFQDYQAGDRDKPGSRTAIVFNGSPLFTGGGESEIHRWIIEPTLPPSTIHHQIKQ